MKSRIFRKILIFSIIVFLLIGFFAPAQRAQSTLFAALRGQVFADQQIPEEENTSVNQQIFFYYFYGDGCPFCAKVEENFFPGLKERNPELEMRKIEVWGSPQNAKFFREIAVNNYGLDLARLGVPAMFIGEYYFIGLPGEREEKLIEKKVKYCLINDNECLNPQQVSPEQASNIRRLDYITLPFIGEVNVKEVGFPLITIMIAAADGFNPCALWILMFLLLLVLKEPLRKRLVLIVGTFILVSGIFYFFLLSAWLKLFLFIGYIRTIQVVIGLVALGTGILQIKSFLTSRTNVCKISQKGGKIRNIIIERAKRVVAQKSVFLTIIGVSILAVMVNFFEFLCSAGFPAIWSSLLALQGFEPIYNFLFTLLYVFVFMLDQIIIFTIAFVTLKVTKISDKITKWMALIGGVLMIILGLIILFKPELLVFV